MTTATKVNIKPLEDRIVVTVLESEQTTASGIVIPDTAKEKPQEGTVLGQARCPRRTSGISGLTVPTSVCDAVGTRTSRVLTPVLALTPSECKLPPLATPPTIPTWRHIGVAGGRRTPICLHVGVAVCW